MDPLIFESFLPSPEPNQFYSSYEVKLQSPQWVFIGGEETLLAGLGLKNLCWFSEYEPGILYTCLCNVQTDFLLAISFMRKVYSKDLSPNVGAFGFRWFWDPVWTTPSVAVLQVLLFRTYLFARWWSLTRNWVLSSDCTFCNCIWRSSFGGMRIATVADFFFSSADLAVCLQTQLSPNLHPLQFGILCIREHANNYMHFPFWATSSVEFYTR